jgi:hypothetical protein
MIGIIRQLLPPVREKYNETISATASNLLLRQKGKNFGGKFSPYQPSHLDTPIVGQEIG